MTKEEWQKVEQHLMGYPGRIVCLKVDNYDKIQVQTMLYMGKLVYQVFIDGKFNCKWLLEDCDIRRRFCNVKKRSLLPQKELKKWLKGLTPAQKKAEIKRNQYYIYNCYYTSVRTLRSHFTRNNKNIVFIELS